MAKQTNRSLGSSLIQSARYMYGTQNKPVDTSDFTSGMQNYTSDYKKQKEAKLAEEETKAADYLGKMEVMDMGVVPEQYSEKVENSLKYLRDEYFKTTMILKDLKPTDRQYLDQSNRLNQLNASIKKISSVFSDLNNNKEEDLKTIKNRNYSKGNDVNKVSFVNKVLTGDAEIEITENGQVYFKNDNQQWVSYEKIPDLTPYASKEFKSILQRADALSKSTAKLTDSDKLILRSSLENMITEGGRDIVVSLAADDFIIPGGMGIIDAEAEYNKNADAFIDKVVNSYMGFYEKTAEQGYNRYMGQLYTEQAIKNQGKSTGGKLTEKEKMAEYINSEAGWSNLKDAGYKSGDMFYEWNEEDQRFDEFKLQYVGIDKRGNITYKNSDVKDKQMRPIPTGRTASNPSQLVTIMGLIQPYEADQNNSGLPRSN